VLIHSFHYRFFVCNIYVRSYSAHSFIWLPTAEAAELVQEYLILGHLFSIPEYATPPCDNAYRIDYSQKQGEHIDINTKSEEVFNL
jgi:hypothetical protein